jgi:hypothetical protein
VARQGCGVMLTVPVGPDRERAVRATRSWFEQCAERLLGSPGAFVRTTDPLPEWMKAEMGVKLRPPAGTTGTPWQWDSPYSPAAWAELLRRLDPLPDHASFEAWTDSDVLFGVSMSAVDGFAELYSTVADGLLNDPAGEQRILATVREAAETAAPVAAAVAAEATFLTTPLERALARFGVGLPEAGALLRNYGWLTVLGDEMAERVGGGDRLRASGAFVEAERLAAGGWWLLATKTWDEYGPEQANRLFELLAPVLAPGRPEPAPAAIALAMRDPRELTGGA